MFNILNSIYRGYSPHFSVLFVCFVVIACLLVGFCCCLLLFVCGFVIVCLYLFIYFNPEKPENENKLRHFGVIDPSNTLHTTCRVNSCLLSLRKKNSLLTQESQMGYQSASTDLLFLPAESKIPWFYSYFN